MFKARVGLSRSVTVHESFFFFAETRVPTRLMTYAQRSTMAVVPREELARRSGSRKALLPLQEPRTWAGRTGRYKKCGADLAGPAQYISTEFLRSHPLRGPSQWLREGLGCGFLRRLRFFLGGELLFDLGRDCGHVHLVSLGGFA